MAGGGRLGEPEHLALEVPTGGVLLLCSDGLHSTVSPEQLAERLGRYLPAAQAGVWRPQQVAVLQQAAQAAADDLIQTAAAQGSEDDITVLLALRCGPHDDKTDARGGVK